MMLTIHGLPTNITYPNLKAVIKKECKITEFILGVLALDDDGTKKVRIGVADDKEGNIVMKCLDGYRLSGHVLRVIPMGKTTNTYNDTNYEWRSNQQSSNYDNRAIEPVSNRSSQWPIQSTPQWNANQQEISPQMQNQSNFGFSQQGPNIQPSFYQQHEARPQNKMYGQQESYSYNRGVQQQQSFSSTKDQKIPYGNRNALSNIIKPQKSNQSRPHVLTNVEITEHPPTRSQVQGGRYSAQDYNPKGTGMKEHFQGSSQYNAGVPSNQPHYQDQGYSPQWSMHKTYTISKHESSQYEKQSYGNDMMHTDKGMIHDQGKGSNEWNQYEKGRRSPQRDRSGLPERRMSPSGHRVSPSGHRILPSGRRISPHRRNSPPGPNIPQTGRRVSPPGRKISPPGRRFSPRRELLQHGRDIPASVRRISPPARIISPSGRRFSPSGRQMSQPSQGISPSGRQMSQPSQGISPSGRKISPSARNIPQIGRGIPPTGRISPSGMGISPSGRRISPPGRRISPHGRKMSPVDRRMLPTDRRISPNGRRISPSGHRGPQSDHRPLSNIHRISPSARRMSPGLKGNTHMGPRLSPRRMSPGKPHRDISTIGGVSPNRGPAQREYGRYSSPHTDNMRPIPDKDVRPAYDPTPQAQSQPMYSGGYTQRARENVTFATTAPRSGDQRPLWQDREKPYNILKPSDDRGVVPRSQKFDSPRELDYQRGINQPEGKLHSPGRMSRSPNRRERSPIRDRYRRHSPSPRSPRRSWALEKRQSPENHETQLPPVWQSKESPYAMQNRPNDERITDSVWEKPYEEKDSPVVHRKEDTRGQDLGDRRYYSSPPRTRWGPKVALPIEHRDPSLTLVRQEDRFKVQRTNFSPRDDFSRHVPADCETRQDRDGHRDFMQDHKNENYRQRSDERKSDLRLGPDALEIEDVFKRAAELAKKTEEHRKKRSEKSNYSKEPESLRDEKHETKSYDKPIRSNQNPYEASSSYRGSGQSRDLRNVDLSPNVQYKRDKAIDELAEKLLQKYGLELKGKNRDEVEERLKLIIESIIFDMFGDKDVSFIEIVIKFEDRHHNKDLERIMHRAMSDAPVENRRLKRSAPDESHVPAKISRDSPSSGMNRDQSLLNANRFFNSNVNITPSPLMPQLPLIVQLPSMVTLPYVMSQPVLDRVYSDQSQEGHYLFLCKNNFQPFSDAQVSLLKNFIFSKIASATELGNNWSPDLTLREVQNEMRLEVWTHDEQSKYWLMNLDFQEFTYFNVLTYSAEELWYKRAAIWLPGHLKKQILAPIEKLKLQNRYLTDVNIDKWKLVKEIVTEKGTRLYVDIPPSCANALEAYDMLLSYELQKVHVFLKAVAVDKNAFDAGLEERSLTINSDLQKQNATMPAINMQDPNIMKFCLAGKTIQLGIARKIKEALIYNIFKYLREGGRNKMDFLKYGFTKPGHFCVVPENEETGKWVSSVNLGQINGQRVTVSGAYCEDMRFFTVSIALPYEKGMTPKKVLQIFKLSNRGEKGIKFHMWKNGHVFPSYQGKRLNYRVDVDIASIDTLIKLNFVLDYSVDNHMETVHLKPEDPISSLEDIVNKWKAKARDSLDVTNMDISTDDDDVVCLN